MTMFQGSMYVRVKREKITYFIQADPSDTILELKEKLQEHLDKVSSQRRSPSQSVLKERNLQNALFEI